MFRIILFCLSLGVTNIVEASSVYKCKDSKGKTTYSEKICKGYKYKQEQNKTKLTKLEMRIDKRIRAALCFLSMIRDEGLYKAKYETFEKYIDDRWGFYESLSGYQLDATSLTKKNGICSDKKALDKGEKVRQIGEFLPDNESQIRPPNFRIKNRF